MGTCCSKIDSKNDCASFRAALHPGFEQWQAQTTCQFCQLHGVSGHLHCCMCNACRKSALSVARYGAEGLAEGGGYHHPRCSLCMADAHEAELRREPCVSCSQSSSPTDGADDTMCLDSMQNDQSTEQDPVQGDDHASKYDLVQGCHCVPKHDVSGHQYALRDDLNADSDHAMTHEDLIDGSQHMAKHDFLLMDTHWTLSEPDAEMLPPRTLASSSNEVQDVIMLSEIAAYDFLSTSMRLARRVSIDNSDGIKLEVRYKHMLPHDAQRSTIDNIYLRDDHVHKRTRSAEKLLAGDTQANRSIRRRKSFQIDTDGLNLQYEHGKAVVSERESDEIDEDDDDFHDITVGVSISSLHTDPEYTINGLRGDTQHCSSMYPSHQSQGNIPMIHVQDGLNYVMNRIGMLNLDDPEFDQPVYLLSKENMQFISEEEREWEVRAEAMGMEDKIGRAQALSVVSTGDAILFSGANSDEFHLIPSVFVQNPKSPVSSPIQNLSPARLMSSVPDEQEPEKSALSVEDIILLLENDELNEDDLFSLLIDSCAKSSPSSSPSSSSSSSHESMMVWSSPLSSSSSSSSSSTLSSSASSSTTSMLWLPSSSTPTLQLPASSTACSLPLSYSLSLPASCKMSPHTSFEFKVKSCSSTPSTPVFSPIRSRTKRNITQLKPSALTTGEIAEIWGLLEQRQACVSKQTT